MATRAEIKAEQSRLKSSGHYSGAIDGVEGDATRMARDASARDAASSGAKKADAEARAAEAKAKGAQAEVDLINAKAKADRERTAAENAGVDRATQVAMNVGAAAAGVGVGHRIAAGIEARHLTYIAANNQQVKAVGKEARTILAGGVRALPAGAGQLRRLEGVVATANNLKLGKIAGPRGVIAAGILLTEAAISRFVVAPKLEDETAREAVNSVATLGVFGATTILSERSIANATPQSLPSGKDLTAIETAKAVVKTPAVIAAVPTSKVTAAAAVKVGGKLALKALTPVAALVAAVSMFKDSAQAGESMPVAAAKAVAAGADSVLTAGALTAVVSDPHVQGEMAKQRSQPRGARGSAPIVTAPQAVKVAASAAFGVLDLVFAKGFMDAANKPSVGLVSRLGLRGAGIVSGAIGAGMVVNALSGGVKDDEGLDGFSTSQGQGKAYLNSGAQQKAESPAVPVASMPAPGMRTAGTLLRSDGQTQSYTRIDPRTGKSVEVKGYATPK